MSNQKKPPEDKTEPKNDQKPYVVSDYIGVPKVETVANFVQSAYCWFRGFSDAKPLTPGTDVKTIPAAGQKIAPHPGNVHIMPTAKNKMTADGEKLSVEQIKSEGVSAENIEEGSSKNMPVPKENASASANSRASNNMQFSFMNQLRELEDSKNKDFVVPDKDYFGGRDSAPVVHKPNSYRLAPKKTNNNP